MIVQLYELVAKPVHGSYHHWNECGWHYETFNRAVGRYKFRTEINEILHAYQSPMQLTQAGSIERFKPNNTLADTTTPTPAVTPAVTPLHGTELMSRKKYQVFISSTFSDLVEERKAVTRNVLVSRHIPVGMESFTAADNRGWRTIQRVIDDTDYYVLIIAGRYGTVDASTGISWTHREYNYARANGIPILAFIRNQSHITADAQERGESEREKLQEFIDLVRDSHLVTMWQQSGDLAAQVSEALRNHIEDDIAEGKQRPGWYRGGHQKGTLPELKQTPTELSQHQAMMLTVCIAMSQLPGDMIRVDLLRRDRDLNRRLPDEFDQTMALHFLTHNGLLTSSDWENDNGDVLPTVIVTAAGYDWAEANYETLKENRDNLNSAPF